MTVSTIYNLAESFITLFKMGAVAQDDTAWLACFLMGSLMLICMFLTVVCHKVSMRKLTQLCNDLRDLVKT